MTAQARIDRIDRSIADIAEIKAAADRFGSNFARLLDAAKRDLLLSSIEPVLKKALDDIAAKELDLCSNPILYRGAKIVVKIVRVSADECNMKAVIIYPFEMRLPPQSFGDSFELDSEIFKKESRLLIDSISFGNYVPFLQSSPVMLIFDHMSAHRLRDYKRYKNLATKHKK